jgi:outer membrane protein assembly factor BamB
MSLVQVVLRPNTVVRESGAAASALLDILIDGVSITARAGEAQGLTLLAELAGAVQTLRKGRASRASAQLCAGGDTWELGLESDGDDVLLSVFRGGPCPEVSVFERRVPLSELEGAVRSALTTALGSHLPAGHRSVLEAAVRGLDGRALSAKPLPRSLVQDRVLVKTVGGLEIQADASFRVVKYPTTQTGEQVERTDLHALLVPGRFRIAIGRKTLTLTHAHLFLLAERLLWLAEDGLSSFQAARPLFRRLDVEGVRIGIRRGPGDAPLGLTWTVPGPDGTSKTLTLSDVEVSDFVEATARFAEALSARYVQHDPRQEQNLRLKAIRDAADRLMSQYVGLKQEDAITNPEPEAFKSYGIPSVRPRAMGRYSESGTLRFVPRWVATIPGVDLRSTFLVGNHLLVSGAREIAAINATTGEVTWRVPSERAATVVTPLGIIRIHDGGRIRMHDLDTGAVKYVTKIAPRTGGGSAGALVNTVGLPRLLLVAEGQSSVTALDLATGDVRWRYSAARGENFRIRRAGRLAILSGGSSALTAIDVTTGEVVWRVRDRLPFTGDIAIAPDSAFALSASSVGTARLHHIDLWTGELRFTRALDEQPILGTAPLLCDESVIIPTRDHRGVGATAFRRESGELAWEQAPGLASGTSAWLELGDSVVVNSASGTLACLDEKTGDVRYRHVFARPVEADLARRLEPVLEGGALFVPQHDVQVLRPKTGEMIGRVPCDLIPDLLRVDQNCNVFIAEESGHLAAYSSAPALRLVR